MKTVKKKPLTQLVPLLALGVIVLASVFVYNPVTGTLTPQKPPVIFDLGSNAGQTDLGGQTITVTLGPSSTSATVTIHPTYEKNYYKNVTLIKNQDAATAYNIWIKVTDPLSDPKILSAQAIIRDSTGPIATVDLTTTGTPISVGNLAASGKYTIDLVVTIDHTGGAPGTAPSLTDNQFTFEVIYTPSAETPP